jgi:hypothetical protein
MGGLTMRFKSKPKPVSPEEVLFIRNNGGTMTRKQMADALNRTEQSIKGIMHRHGIKTGRDGLFVPGQKSWNKGTKGLTSANKTSFKKGNLPKNTLFDKAITLRKDNRGVLIKWIRISKSKWEALHRYLWEEAHGPVPEGYIVSFKDGDPMNCVLENLELITMAENAGRNSGHMDLNDSYIASLLVRGEPELKPLIMKQTALLELKRTQIKFNRIINEKTDKRS